MTAHTAVTGSELPEAPGAYDIVFDHTDGRYDGRYDLLGFGSGRRPGHMHPLGEEPAPRRRCLACRWTEIRILVPLDEGVERYVVHTAGRSAVRGERTLHRMLETTDPGEVIQILMTQDADGGHSFMPPTAAVALRQACEVDDDLGVAYAEHLDRAA